MLGIDPVIVPILRTGLVMAEAFQEVMPQTLTGHIGLHRDKGDPNRKLLQYLVSLPDSKGRLRSPSGVGRKTSASSVLWCRAQDATD